MGKQSARLYYQGNDHKDIYFGANGYHCAMFKGDTLVWKQILGDLVFGSDRGNSPIIIDFENRSLYQPFFYQHDEAIVKGSARISFLDKGFVRLVLQSLPDEDTVFSICYSEDCIEWRDTGKVFENSGNSVPVGNCLFWVGAQNISVYDGDTGDVKKAALDEEVRVTALSNNGNYCLLKSASGFIIFVDKELSMTKVKFPEDVFTGSKRIYRTLPIYSFSDKAYYLMNMQEKESDSTKVLYTYYLCALDINGTESVIGIIDSLLYGYYDSTYLNEAYVYVLKMGDRAQIYFGGYLIEIGQDGNSMTVKKQILDISFPIKTYKKGILQENSVSIDSMSRLSSANHLYKEKGKLKKDAIIFHRATTKEITYIMVRDFFESDKNIAIIEENY